MKRYITLFFAIILALSISGSAFAIEDPAFSVKVVGMFDTAKTYNSQNTLVVDWRIMANKAGLNLRGIQALQLAYDNTILQLMKWDGSDVVADTSVGASFGATVQTAQAGVYNVGIRLYAARDATGRTGFLSLSLGDPFEPYACPNGAYVSLEKVRFAFREGKSAAGLAAGSIRLMAVEELAATAQRNATILCTDENGGTIYEYRIQANGALLGGDSLDAPVISYPGQSGDAPGQTVGDTDPTGPPIDSPASSSFINPYSDVKEDAWYYPAVKYATENGLVNGTGNNKFSPDVSMTRAMFATLLYRMAGQPEVKNASPFFDVPNGEWYSQAISWANGNGIIMGTGNNRFRPNDIVAREQAATALYRYSERGLGLDVSGQASLSQYKDASQISSWARPALQWAVHAGVMSGRSDATLAPLDNMTRAEVAQVILNFANAY